MDETPEVVATERQVEEDRPIEMVESMAPVLNDQEFAPLKV